MKDNNEILLISNDFQLKSYINSLDDDFSFIKLHVHFKEISNSDFMKSPIYIAYFFKAIVQKYSKTCHQYDFNIFKLEVVDIFIGMIQRMFSDHYYNPGRPINSLFNNLPKSLQISTEFKYSIIQQFTSHYGDHSYAKPDHILYTLLFLKSISTPKQINSINNRLFIFISEHKNSFYLSANCSNEEIYNFMKNAYQDFINSKLVNEETA